MSNDIDVLKLKIKFNYTLARMNAGGLYTTTKDFLESSVDEQNKTISFLDSMGRKLIAYKKKYNSISPIAMTELEFKNGFKE